MLSGPDVGLSKGGRSPGREDVVADPLPIARYASLGLRGLGAFELRCFSERWRFRHYSGEYFVIPFPATRRAVGVGTRLYRGASVVRIVCSV